MRKISSCSRLSPVLFPLAGALIALHLFIFPSVSEAASMAMNERQLHCANDSMKFLALGHLYQKPWANEEDQIVDTLIATLPRLRGSDFDFVMFLGDLVWQASPESFERLRDRLLSQFKVPVYNAVGNHDLGDPKLYKELFGRTYFQFTCGSAQVIVIDSELERGRIVGEQLEFMQQSIARAEVNSDIKQVFIFSHKLLWAEPEKRYDIVYRRMNDTTWHSPGVDFSSNILPLLSRLASKKDVFWGSGDLGVNDEFGLFLDFDPETRITWFAAGLGNWPTDAALVVTVSPESGIEFTPLSLTTGVAIPGHTLFSWKARAIEQSLWRSLRSPIPPVVGLAIFLISCCIVLLIFFMRKSQSSGRTSR